jgi:hypothetical protein
MLVGMVEDDKAPRCCRTPHILEHRRYHNGYVRIRTIQLRGTRHPRVNKKEKGGCLLFSYNTTLVCLGVCTSLTTLALYMYSMRPWMRLVCYALCVTSYSGRISALCFTYVPLWVFERSRSRLRPERYSTA